MFFKLIKRDHVIHYGPAWLPVAFVIGVILAAFGKSGIEPRMDNDYVGPVVLIWTMITMMLGFSQVGLRTDSLKLSLPVAARKVWLARVTSILLFMIGMIAASVLFMVLVSRGERPPFILSDAAPFAAALVAVILLAVALVQCYRPSLSEVPMRRLPVLYMVTVWGVCLAVLFVLVSVRPVWSVLPAVLSLLLLASVWRKIPKSFVGQPVGTPSLSTRDDTSATSILPRAKVAWSVTPDGLSRRQWRRLLTKTILRTLYQPALPAVIVAAIVAFLGVYISGFYPEPLSGPVYLLWIVGIAPVMVVWPASRVFKLDHLPLSRRAIFPFLSLPMIVLLWVGFMGSTIIGHTFAPREPLREYLSTRECPFYSRVPDRFLRVAWDGNPPVITAPWGETHQPWVCRPIKGRRAVLYSPYSIPKGSSRDFAAWQLSREIEIVYGAAVSPETINEGFDRYFETREDGTYKLIAWGDPLRADLPALELQDWVRPMVATSLITAIVWFLVVGWLVRTFFAGASPSTFSAVARVLPALVPIVFVAVIVWLGEFGYTSSWKLTALGNAAIRRVANALPSNPVAMWGMFVIIVAALYLFAETSFRRAQSPAVKPQGR